MTPTGDPGPAGPDDRRDEERLAVLGGLQGEVMILQPMAITEIGCGGVQVETAFPFHIDSLHEIRLALGDRPIVVKGRVTHCTIIDVDQEFVRYRSGIQFIELSERAYEVIATFVDAIKDGRRGA
jgi:hypothetical protein